MLGWLPAFSPFSTMFFKGLFYMVVKKSGLCGRSKGLNDGVYFFKELGWIEFNNIFNIVQGIEEVAPMCFLTCLMPVLTQLSFQRDQLLFSHASTEVRG